MQEVTDINSCVLLMHIKNSIRHIFMMVALTVVMRYHQIQQQRHLFYSVQPYISLIVGYNYWNTIRYNAIIFILKL